MKSCNPRYIAVIILALSALAACENYNQSLKPEIEYNGSVIPVYNEADLRAAVAAIPSGGGGTVTLMRSFTLAATVDIDDRNVAIGGGGVSVDGSISVFTMKAGVISGNTSSFGGGVTVFSGDGFTKTGGIIYGDTDAAHNPGDTENTATSGDTNGHAAYYTDGTDGYYRDATLGEGDGISTAADKLPTVPGAGGSGTTNWIMK
jgi:hypothetical protein